MRSGVIYQRRVWPSRLLRRVLRRHKVAVRQPLSLYPAAAMVARAYLYDITMSFASSTYPFEETGSANQPWNTVREGADLAPFGQLLLIPGTYNGTTPLTLSRPMIISVARGGMAIIGQRP